MLSIVLINNAIKILYDLYTLLLRIHFNFGGMKQNVICISYLYGKTKQLMYTFCISHYTFNCVILFL